VKRTNFDAESTVKVKDWY